MAAWPEKRSADTAACSRKSMPGTIIQTERKSWDVVVIGGGPAGSTAAALLAHRGFRVRVFEKARHPRFHIGESLLPANLRLFERLPPPPPPPRRSQRW